MTASTTHTDDRWMTSKEAALHLGYSPDTLRRSRVSKQLGGKDTPSFTKSGTAIRYKKSDLDAWMMG